MYIVTYIYYVYYTYTIYMTSKFTQLHNCCILFYKIKFICKASRFYEGMQTMAGDCSYMENMTQYQYRK